MKKVFLLIIMILLLPLFVYAEDNNLVLKSIELVKISEDVEELSPATIENNKINLDLKMYEVGDTAEYIVRIENTSDKDLYIEKNLVVTESNYFDYELLGSDKSTVIEKNSEKEFVLKVKYQNEVEKENFFSAKYKDISKLSFQFRNGSNPETKRNIILLFIVFLLIFIAFKYNKKSKILLLLFVLVFIPFMTQAENSYNMEINSNILIKKVKPNPCTFDGELVQGAEYTNGQYTYRYMQEGGWQNIESEGWGVVLTDINSEEDVTSKLCTSINDKPIVSTSYMFYDSRTKNIDLSSFDTSNVTNMSGMFYYTTDLESLDLSTFDTSNVTNMSGMFASSINIKSLDLHYFDTSNVTNMLAMFSHCNSLINLDLSRFNTSQVTNMTSMFINCRNLTILDLNGFDTSQVTTMSSMFYNCSSLTSLDLSAFDTSQVTTMSSMFYNCSSLTSLDLSSFDTSKVTTMSAMFYNCSNLTSLDLSVFDTSKVTNMGGMFYGNTLLETLNLDGFNLTSSTNGSSIISGMFSGTNNLKKVSMKNWKIPENFTHAIGCRVSSLCSTALESIDVTEWNLSQTKNVEGLFGNSSAKKIEGLDTWDTSNINYMPSMFDGANRLESLDLSSFDTSMVTNTVRMFYGTSLLKTIKVSDKFQTNQVTNSDLMFKDATSLVGGNGTVYDANHIDKEYARIDTLNTPGYFTSVH